MGLWLSQQAVRTKIETNKEGTKWNKEKERGVRDSRKRRRVDSGTCDYIPFRGKKDNHVFYLSFSFLLSELLTTWRGLFPRVCGGKET